VRLSVELLPDAPAVEVLAAIQAADASAIDTVFCVDELYHRDAWALLSAAARETRRVRLVPGVAHVTLRDPLLVAQQLATLDELSGGRAAAAFSVGNLAMLAQCGRDPAGLRPAPRLREAHRAMRSLLDTGMVDLDGEFFSYRGGFTTARPVAPRVPLLIGAMSGPLTVRLAGEIADGIYAACSFSREALTYIVDNVRIGATKAGRELAHLDLCASLTAAVADDGRAPRRAPEGGLLPAVDATSSDRAPRCAVQRDRADQRRLRTRRRRRSPAPHARRARRPLLPRRHPGRGRRADPRRDPAYRLPARIARALRRCDPACMGRDRHPRPAQSLPTGAADRRPATTAARRMIFSAIDRGERPTLQEEASLID
jgi:alkanesulfonate monooxygenase SsuD/methylene tetrahydromethanopterin reductase-like flavin-dependent oxidoreductase (luciferase family)